MILQSLRDLALREGLVDDPAFESKPVRWVIEVRADGTFKSVYDTNAPQTVAASSKRKPKLEAKLMLIPRRAVRASGVRANFLVDNAKYALGMDGEGKTGDPKNKERHRAFIALLQEAQAAAPSPALKAVLIFLAPETERSACMTKLQTDFGGFADNDLFSFEVNGESLHELEELRLYWSSQQTGNGVEAVTSQCLMCGEERAVTPLHNQIQIRGGSTTGVPVVSFNSDAFESFGWSGNANAPVCESCMTAYVEGIRRLTRARYDNPRTGERVSPLNTVLNDDTTAIYWSEQATELVTAVPALRDNPKAVRDLLLSPLMGSQHSVNDANRFYCLVLTGTQGRAIVRRMHTGTVGELAANLERYFQAIDVDRYDTTVPMPQFRLLQSMVLKGELKRLSPELGTELWLAALFGTLLSRVFLSAVIGRNVAERAVSSERAALLQLYFSSHRQSSTTGSPERKESQTPEEPAPAMSLNRESKDPAYLLGRLLSVLENVQTAAQGSNLNRTLVDRTFGAASTRPGVVFPQLIQTAQHHFAKAGKKAAGRAVNLDKQLGEILDGLDIDGFASTLSVEQQGRFALGYYHQRQSFFRGRPTTGDAPLDEHHATEHQEIAT